MSELQYIDIWDPNTGVALRDVSVEVLDSTLARAAAEFDELSNDEAELTEHYDQLNEEPGGIDAETARDLDREHMALCEAMHDAETWRNDVRAELGRRGQEH